MSTFRARIHFGPGGKTSAIELSGIPVAAIGHDATFTLHGKVDVKRSSGIDSNAQWFEHQFKVQSGNKRIALHDDPAPWYRYRGNHIDLAVTAKLKIDDGLVFDTKLECAADVAERELRRGNDSASSLIEPHDTYSFAANMKALSPKDRLVVRLLIAIGGLISLGNAAIGIHDEFVPESQIVFYDHSGDDGSESPTMKSLTGSGGLGLALWLMVRARLRRYMRFELKKDVATPRRGERRAVRTLVEGEARVDLDGSTLRVVAANREHGQYTQRSNKKTETKSFCETVQALVLFEQHLPHIPAGSPLADHLNSDVDFDPIFTELLPPLMLGRNHGVDVVWEVQLIHPEFVDQEVQGPFDWVATDWHALDVPAWDEHSAQQQPAR